MNLKCNLRSSCLRIKSKRRWITITNGSSSPALHSWRMVCLRAPLQPSERCLFLAFAFNIGATPIIMLPRLSRRETLKKFTCCASTVCLWQYTMREKEYTLFFYKNVGFPAQAEYSYFWICQHEGGLQYLQIMSLLCRFSSLFINNGLWLSAWFINKETCLMNIYI